MKRVQFVGLDVHADTIAVAVAGATSRPRPSQLEVQTILSPMPPTTYAQAVSSGQRRAAEPSTSARLGAPPAANRGQVTGKQGQGV